MTFEQLHAAGVEAYFAGRFEDAERLWGEALAIEPRALGTWTNRGAALHDLARYDEALACYDAALKLKRDHPEAYSNRARTLIELKRFVEALGDCERAIALQPDYVDAWVNRSAVQKALARYDEALQSCDKALALAPGSAAALTARGNVLIELGRYGEALALFEELAARAPSLIVWVQLGLCYQHRGRHREAIVMFDRVLAIKPDYHEVISNKIFAMDFIDTTVEVQQEARKDWWRNYGAKIVEKEGTYYPIRADAWWHPADPWINETRNQLIEGRLPWQESAARSSSASDKT